MSAAKWRRLHRNQKGTALIAALLAAALVTTLAGAMLFMQQLDIRRSGNIFHGDQAWLYAMGVENWTTLLLGRAAPGEENEFLGRPMPPTMVEGGQVSGRMDDLQGLFNVNNLVLADENQQGLFREQFRRLLVGCGLDGDLEQAVSDWLDSDQEVRFPGGAEDREYLRRDPPYRTADRSISDPAELAMVYGFDTEEFSSCLQPLLCALPEATPLNVSTASPALLASLADSIGREEAERLAAERPVKGYANMTEFLKLPALAGSGITPTVANRFLDVQSRYFLLQSEAVIGQSRVELFSVVKRQGQAIKVLRRSR